MTWTVVGNLTGPAGATGDIGATGSAGSAGSAGSTGATGARGAKIYTGAGTPDVVALSAWNPSGVTFPPAAGDVYINSVTGAYSVMS